MRLLCISYLYPPIFEGGYEISVKQTMDYLIERGHEVYILCSNKGVDKSRIIKDIMPGQPLRILKVIDYVHGGFLDKHKVETHNYRETKSLIKTLKPELVYFGSMKSLSIAPVIAVQKLRQPHVFDLGDIWLKAYHKPGIKNSLFRALKKWAFFTVGGEIKLDPVIVLSQWMKQQIAELYGSKQVYVVPRGTDIPVSNPRNITRPLRYLFAGRIEPFKGLDICIKAVAIVLTSNPGFEFCMDIYGDSDAEYETYCVGLIRKYGLETRFNFRGRSKNIHTLMPDYDILIMPTLAEEAFGRVIIEAMSHKLIVVATNAYGPKEIISNNVDGILFERGSETALAESILYVNSLDEAKLEVMRKSAYQTVYERYSNAKVKREIESILDSIVSSQVY